MEQPQVQQDDDARDPLVRMARRNHAQAAQQQASFQAALSQAFGRMCARYPGLDGTVVEMSRRTVSLAELVDMTEPGVFLALLDGPEEAMGMVWLCPDALAALVEAQTTGQVSPPLARDGPPRMPTRTDAALIAPMVESFLDHAAERCADLPEGAEFGGFRYGSFLDDRRPIGVVLDDVDYRLLQLRISIAQGQVAGLWTLVLPCPAPAGATRQDDTDDWDKRMVTAVENSPTELDAVLCRLTLTLNEALALSNGDVLRIPESSLETLGLAAKGGGVIATGRLGQARGFRAIRLTADPYVSPRGDARSAPTLRLYKAPPPEPPPPDDRPDAEQGSEPVFLNNAPERLTGRAFPRGPSEVVLRCRLACCAGSLLAQLLQHRAERFQVVAVLCGRCDQLVHRPGAGLRHGPDNRGPVARRAIGQRPARPDRSSRRLAW